MRKLQIFGHISLDGVVQGEDDDYPAATGHHPIEPLLLLAGESSSSQRMARASICCRRQKRPTLRDASVVGHWVVPAHAA